MIFFGLTVLFVITNVLGLPQLDVSAQANPQSRAPLQQSAGLNRQDQSGNTTPIAIINQTEEVGPDGSVNFSYETANGIHVQENLFTKKNENVRANPQDPDSESSGDIQVIQGTFTYTAPDGQVITLRYIADENGFQPQGDHLPTPPPVPQEIADAVSALQNQLQNAPQQVGQHQQQQQLGQQQSFGQQQQQQFGQQQQLGQQQPQQQNFGQQPQQPLLAANQPQQQ